MTSPLDEIFSDSEEMDVTDAVPAKCKSCKLIPICNIMIMLVRLKDIGIYTSVDKCQFYQDLPKDDAR